MNVNDSGTLATQIISLGPLTARGSENLLNIEDITTRYLSQAWPGSLGRLADEPAPPAPIRL